MWPAITKRSGDGCGKNSARDHAARRQPDHRPVALRRHRTDHAARRPWAAQAACDFWSARPATHKPHMPAWKAMPCLQFGCGRAAPTHRSPRRRGRSPRPGYHSGRPGARPGDCECAGRIVMTAAPDLECLCARAACVSALAVLALSSAPLLAQEPIKIGFGVSLTGGLASSGKAHLLAKQIWLDEINAKGGLLGRPLQARLLRRPDQCGDRSGHLRQADRCRQGRHRDGRGDQPHRRRHADDHGAQEDGDGAPWRSAPTRGVQVSEIFPERAVRARTRRASCRPTRSSRSRNRSSQPPRTVALVGADAEFSTQRAHRRARERRGSSTGLQGSSTTAPSPPNTVDFTPIVRAIQATNPDVDFCSRPIRRTRSAWCAPRPRSRLKTQLFGGAMVGMQYASLIAGNCPSQARPRRELPFLRS